MLRFAPAKLSGRSFDLVALSLDSALSRELSHAANFNYKAIANTPLDLWVWIRCEGIHSETEGHLKSIAAAACPAAITAVYSKSLWNCCELWLIVRTQMTKLVEQSKYIKRQRNLFGIKLCAWYCSLDVLWKMVKCMNGFTNWPFNQHGDSWIPIALNKLSTKIISLLLF